MNDKRPRLQPPPIPADTLRSILALQLDRACSQEATTAFGALVNADAQRVEELPSAAAQGAPVPTSPGFMTRDELRAELIKIRARMFPNAPQE